MPSARELLEQADALMRRNRGDSGIPVLTDSVPEVAVVPGRGSVAPAAPVLRRGRKRPMHLRRGTTDNRITAANPKVHPPPVRWKARRGLRRRASRRCANRMRSPPRSAADTRSSRHYSPTRSWTWRMPSWPCRMRQRRAICRYGSVRIPSIRRCTALPARPRTPSRSSRRDATRPRCATRTGAVQRRAGAAQYRPGPGHRRGCPTGDAARPRSATRTGPVQRRAGAA